MNTKICPGCKKDLAAYMETCPFCGTDMRSVAEILVKPIVPPAVKQTQPSPEQEKPAPQQQSQKQPSPEQKISAPQPQSQAPVNNSGENYPTTPQRPKSTGEIFWGIMGIVCGITIFIVGLVNISLIDSVRFGADFYTEIHEVTAACATGIYGLYVVIGIALVVYYGYKLSKE